MDKEVERLLRQRAGLPAGSHLMSPDVLSYCVRCGVTEAMINAGEAEWCAAAPEERIYDRD